MPSVLLTVNTFIGNENIQPKVLEACEKFLRDLEALDLATVELIERSLSLPMACCVKYPEMLNSYVLLFASSKSGLSQSRIVRTFVSSAGKKDATVQRMILRMLPPPVSALGSDSAVIHHIIANHELPGKLSFVRGILIPSPAGSVENSWNFIREVSPLRGASLALAHSFHNHPGRPLPQLLPALHDPGTCLLPPQT